MDPGGSPHPFGSRLTFVLVCCFQFVEFWNHYASIRAGGKKNPPDLRKIKGCSLEVLQNVSLRLFFSSSFSNSVDRTRFELLTHLFGPPDRFIDELLHNLGHRKMSRFLGEVRSFGQHLTQFYAPKQRVPGLKVVCHNVNSS